MEGKKVAGVLVGAGIFAGIIYALTRKRTPPPVTSIGLKWGTNGETGPQTMVFGTSQLLKLTATNPTTANWEFDIEYKINNKRAAFWEGLTIQAGKTVELPWEVILGPYIRGDAKLDGEVNGGDSVWIDQMIVQPGNYPLNLAMDSVGDGVFPLIWYQDGQYIQAMDNQQISYDKQRKIDRLIMGQDPLVTENGVASGPGTYTSKVTVTEKTTGRTWAFDFDPITLVAGEGTVNVTSNPSGAAVTINGVAQGNTPFTIDLEPGTYNVEALLDGYNPFIGSFVVVAGVPVDFLITMELLPTKLNIQTTPAGAELIVNGTSWGLSNLLVPVEPGTYNIRAVLVGYEEQTQTITAVLGHTVDVFFELVAKIEPDIQVDIKWPNPAVPVPPPSEPTVSINLTPTSYYQDTYNGPAISSLQLFASINNSGLSVIYYLPANSNQGWLLVCDRRVANNDQLRDVLIEPGADIFIGVNQSMVWSY